MQQVRYQLTSLFLFLIIFSQAKAQRNIITISPYNNSDVGKYMSAEYSRIFRNDLTFNVGLLFHLNIDSRNPDRHEDRYLHGRFWAYNIREDIGLTAGLQKSIFHFADEKVRIFAYEQSMFRSMGARSQRHIPIDTTSYFDSSLNKIVYVENSRLVTTDIHKLFSVESVAGLGISADINKRIGFNVKFGVGFNLIFNTPTQYLNNNVVIEYSLQQSIGLFYKF